MSQLNHDRLVDQNEAATSTVRTQRMGDALPSDPTTEEPRLAEVTDLAGLAEQAEATARAGMTEYHRIPAVPVLTGRHGHRRTRGIPVPARRPGFYLAAALLGASGLGLFTVGAGQAQETDVAESSSVSVAADLGLDAASPAAVPEADATARLGELAASRTARETEQTAAAQAQAEADRLAAAAIAEAARPDAVPSTLRVGVRAQVGGRPPCYAAVAVRHATPQCSLLPRTPACW